MGLIVGTCDAACQAAQEAAVMKLMTAVVGLMYLHIIGHMVRERYF
jgi:hypothetical protein